MTQERAVSVDHALGETNYFRVSEWFRLAGKKRNGLTMGVQAGVMVEEMVELFRSMTLSSASGASSVLLTEACRLLDEVAGQLKTGESFLYFYDRKEALDAMCDIDVTVNGVAYLGGFHKAEADTLVINSLFDKFDADGTPVIKPGGKIGKRAGWVAPDLSELVGETAMPSEEDEPFNPLMASDQWVQEFRRIYPQIQVEDAQLGPFILQAIMTGQQMERDKAAAIAASLAGVDEVVRDINAETEAASNSIAPQQ